MAGTGIDARTGKVISGWDHVVQSVFRIFETKIGTRVMRRPFGGRHLDLLGRRLTPQTILLYRLLLVLALERWEPRVRVRKVAFGSTVDGARSGLLVSSISVDYLPRGHLGDATVADRRDIALS